MMTPEHRLDRAERILVVLAVAGRRARKEWREQSREQNKKINILIQGQIELQEIMARSAARHDKEMAELRESDKELRESQNELRELHKETRKELRLLIKSLRKGHNGNS